MRVIGKFIYAIGTTCLAVTVLWAVIICLAIVNQAAGFWGVVIGFVLLPVVFVSAPWYALVAHHTWDPLIIAYGGTLVFGTVRYLGNALAERHERIDAERRYANAMRAGSD